MQAIRASLIDAGEGNASQRSASGKVGHPCNVPPANAAHVRVSSDLLPVYNAFCLTCPLPKSFLVRVCSLF